VCFAADSKRGDAGVYTFGQPKVGNDEFVYELKRHAPSTGFYRVTHNNDVVPSLPRKGYAHCGRRIFVSQDGLLIQVPALIPHVTTRHDTHRTRMPHDTTRTRHDTTRVADCVLCVAFPGRGRGA
jgi:hypothetical protein